MWIDLVSLFVVVFFTAAGYFRGFVALLFTFFGALAAYLGAQHLARLIESWGDWSAVDAETRYWVLAGISTLIIYLGVNFIGLVVAHFTIGEEEHRKKLDRLYGTLLGILQGTFVALFVACLMGAVPEALRETWEWLDEQVEDSRLVQLVEPYNPVLSHREEIGWIRQIGETIEVLGDPDAIADLELPPDVKELLEQPALRELFTDSALVKALRETDYAEIFSREHWRKLVEDSDLREALKEVDVGEIRSEIEEARRKQAATEGPTAEP